MIPSLDIIIVNWNTGPCLQNCITSIELSNHLGFSVMRIIVIDNASKDDSACGLRYDGDNLEIQFNRVNRGFGAACNQGATGCSADYLLFLNPDTELMCDTLSKAIGFMERPNSAEVGICGIRLLDGNGAGAVSCARFPALTTYLYESIALDKIWPKYFPGHLQRMDELSVSRTVDQVIGAFFLVRKNVYTSLAGFDERFFVYFEEVDFSYRALKAGFRTYYLSGVVAKHLGRISSKKEISNAIYYSISSRLKYGYKHFPGYQAVVLVLLTLTVEFLSRFLYACLPHTEAKASDVLSAYRRLLASLTG